MKKIMLSVGYTLSALAITLSLQNCNKDKTRPELPDLQPSTETGTANHRPSNPGISLYYDILDFNSGESLAQTLDLINDNSEKDNATYMEVDLGLQNQSLDSIPPDSLELLDIKMNNELNVYKAYEEFVRTMNFEALVLEFIPLQKSWMKSGGNDLKDPFLKYPYPLAFQSVLNKYHEVKIGTSIYKFDVTSGSVFEITDGDYNTVLALRKDRNAANTKPGVLVYTKTGSCNTFKNANATHNYVRDGKNFRVKSYCGITSSFINAITQNFRKQNNGALLWSMCKMSNTVTSDEVYNNGKCNYDMKTASGVNAANSAFRLEKLVGVLFTVPTNSNVSYRGLNLHTPSQKTRATSVVYDPDHILNVFAW